MKTINFAGTIYKCKDIHILNIDAYMLLDMMKTSRTYQLIMTKNEKLRHTVNKTW
jgi:hypothetical protein